MKKTILLLSPLLAFVLYTTLSSMSSGILGVANFGCTCHDPSPSANTLITLNGLPAGGYVNGATYTLTLSVSNSTVTSVTQPAAGFNISTDAGSFTSGSGSQGFTPDELTHNAPQTLSSGTTAWTFEWTAPLQGSSQVHFNVAANVVNMDGINGTGDEWSLQAFTLNAVNSSSNTLTITCLLEGYYNGSGTMLSVLTNQGAGSNPLVCDSLWAELRDPITLSTVTGSMLEWSVNGQATLPFTSPGTYYLVLKHRSGLETWSANPLVLSAGTNSYSFTTAASQAYGNNLKEMEPGIYAMYSGDVIPDENIDLLDLSLVETDINNFIFGYASTDINGDGNVDLLDSPVIEGNVASFIFSIHP